MFLLVSSKDLPVLGQNPCAGIKFSTVELRIKARLMRVSERLNVAPSINMPLGSGIELRH